MTPEEHMEFARKEYDKERQLIFCPVTQEMCRIDCASYGKARIGSGRNGGEEVIKGYCSHHHVRGR